MFAYKKNDPKIFNILNALGDESLAKRHALRLRSCFEGDDDYKEHKPCTTVDLPVEEPEHPEEILKLPHRQI